MTEFEPLSPYDPRYGAVVPPTAGVFDAPTVQLCMNVEWAAFVDGVLGKLLRRGVWLGDEATQAFAVGEVQKLLISLMQRNPCGEENMELQNSVTLLHRFGTVVSGNPLFTRADAAQAYGYYFRQEAPAVNDKLRFYLSLSAGDYNLDILSIRGAANGRCDVRLNNEDGGSNVVIATGVEFYNSTAQQNYIHTLPFTITESARYSLDFLTSGKHASSSNYYIPITASFIYPM